MEAKNKLIAVKLNFQYESPEQLYGAGAKWIYSYNVPDLTKALDDV